VCEQGLFEDALAGARFAEDQAEAALLGVDAQDVKDFLLVGQKRDGLRWEKVTLLGRIRSRPDVSVPALEQLLKTDVREAAIYALGAQ
jgi:hypothetical protein